MKQQKTFFSFTIIFAGLWILGHSLLSAQTDNESSSENNIHYGENESVGKFVRLNGIRMYYETYGTGNPLLIIHGNGGSISGLKHQIDFFSQHYQVIVADSRGHGRTEIGAGQLTYEQMAEDYYALMGHLKISNWNVLGWSDGGIIGLLLEINHPGSANKLAIMGANLKPEAAYDWAREWVTRSESFLQSKIDSGDSSAPWKTYQQHLGLLGKQPNIATTSLSKILAPTLVMAADRDVIKPEHTLNIFENLPKAQLCIFPGATHMIPETNPLVFNQTVYTFFKSPFKRPDTRSLFE